MKQQEFFYDMYGNNLSLNDLVQVYTSVGIYNGYITFFQKGKVRVNCLPGEYRVTPYKIRKVRE